MGILTGDANLVDAALSEVMNLPLDRRQELDTYREVDYLLVHHHLSLVRKRLMFSLLALIHVI